MKSLKDLRGRLDVVLKEINDLRALDALNEDQDKRFDALVIELNDLGETIVKAENSERAIAAAQGHAATIDRLTESRGRVSAIDPKGDSEQRDVRDQKPLGQRMIESDEFAELRRLNGNGSASLSLKSFHEERAIANTPLLPAAYVQPMRIPGFQRGADQFGSLRDVLLVGTADSDSLVYFRETAFTNNAAEVAEATATTGSTGTKPESALTFDQQTSTVATIAHWIPITKQLIWNANELQSYIEGRLIDGLKLREDAELLNGNGTAPNIRGLLATSGIQVLDATYFTANPVAGVGTSNEKFDRIARARSLVSTVGRGVANFAVLNPADLEKYQTSTDANRQYFGGGPLAGGVPATLWGLRIVVNENLAAGTALVGDGRGAQIWDRMQASITIGTINDQLVRNMFTILAEERVGLTVYRPQAFAKVTLA